MRLRFCLALLLSGLAISGAMAGSDLSSCLDPSTKLDAGGDVSDKELIAAQQACAHLQQSGLDAGTRLRVDHAASTLSDEQQRRQASRRFTRKPKLDALNNRASALRCPRARSAGGTNGAERRT